MKVLNPVFNLIKKNHFTIIFISLLIVYITLSIAFLPFPVPILSGLDPSWQYGISKATEDNLIFGKDIVFTYGPWGYLIHGAYLKSNFWQILLFQWFVHLLFFLILFIRVITIKTKVKKILIGLTIAISIYFIKINSWTGLLADYQILYTYMTVFTFDNIWNKYPKLMSCFLGIIAGFCLLTKFSLGIYLFGFLIIFSLVNLSKSINLASSKKFKDNSLSCCGAFLCFFSTAWLGLYQANFATSLTKIIINLIIALLITWSFLFLLKKYHEKIIKYQEKIADYLPKNIQDSGLLIPVIFCLIYAILIGYTIIFDSTASLIDYIHYSLQISSGYSSGLSVVGERKEFIIGLSNCLIIIWFLFLLTKSGYLNLSLGFLFISWIGFKHGFIRHDSSHFLLFSQTILFIIPLCLAKIKSVRIWKVSFCIYLYILVISLTAFNHYANLKDSIVSRLNNNWHIVSNIKEVKIYNENSTDELLAQFRFPENVNNIIFEKEIDIIPWDISLAPANNLNWQPRPVFQSFMAYTSDLDELNFQSFVQNPRDYLLYTFVSIDARHPFFDEPKTFSFVHCNYAPIEVIEGEYEPVITPIFLLEKLPSSGCSTSNISNKIITKWQQIESIDNPNNSIIQAQLKINYSLWGKIYKTIFRSPPVIIKVTYGDDSVREYRIIPENANNGIILSHLPRDNQEALLFLSGEKKAPVKSFSFVNQNNSLYKSNIEIQLFSYQLNQ